MSKSHDGIKLQGFFKVEIENADGSKIPGAKWNQNTTTNDGIRDYLVDAIVGGTNKTVKYAALGTGGAPGVTTNQLPGELAQATNNNRLLITGGSSIVASKTAQWTGQFASSDSYNTASANISNIGLHSEQSDTGADLFAGNTFASSSFATNQNVNFTYQIRFASA